MVTFASFKETLQEAIHHLQDPDYEPAPELCEILGCPGDVGGGAVQARIIEAVEEMEPAPETPEDSRAWLHYRSLVQRFVLGLTQEKTAESLFMSVRNLQRVQAEALQVLAQTLWQQRPMPDEAQSAAQASNWRSQADIELASLQMRAPNAQAPVVEVLQGVMELEAAVAQRRGLVVSVGHVQPGLIAAAHPMVLRQTLITAIGRLAPFATSDLKVYATLEDGRVKFTLRCAVSEDFALARADLIEGVLASSEMNMDLQQKGGEAFLKVTVPAVGERNVLVVEDNPDMVYFYRRCTAGTRYRIVTLPSARGIFEAVEQDPPDVIVIDVMLPDTDGWQLLTHLSERETTRGIPVIICSVVKERELALALGARAFLSKPVPPRQFVEALDRALAQA